ncbi:MULTISPECIES: hypothetical protein [unclassified Azospirillum]|uniref:hypothetical protein n=1 Tax=unclassified Azospirillum TaxID=2630922 RepID=UPI0011776C14|nr:MULTISPECIES: hypothetical protein [unclassified Azospirillum]
MSDIENYILNARGKLPAYHPLIICLYTAPTFPDYCAPMVRIPRPETGIQVDDSLVEVLNSAVNLNAAIHDGAVMVGRISKDEIYKITGWSFRLYPSSLGDVFEPNRGSAFNSCLAMSYVEKVDALYMLSLDTATCFRSGEYYII